MASMMNSLRIFHSIFIFKGFIQRDFSHSQDNCYVIPYPMTIFPSPYPREDYQRACRIQYGINQLVHRLAHDWHLMDSVFQL